MTKIAAALALALLCGAAVCADAANAAPDALTPEQQLAKMAGKSIVKVVYRGVTVIAGTDAAPRANMAIVVDGERIKAIVPVAQLDKSMTDGAEVVDAGGWFVLPGLIDSHVHYATHPDRGFAEAELKRDVYAGVTGVRDMAGDARLLGDLSRQSLLNEIAAPDIFYASLVAGPSFFQDPRTVASSLGMQPGQAPWMYGVTDKTDMALTIAQARGTGATGLKIYANLSGTLVRRLIKEAKRQKFPVWTHQQVYPATPYDSIGATTVSHVCMIGRFVREPGKAKYGHQGEPSYDGLTAADPGIARYIAALAKSGTIMDATLSVYAPTPEEVKAAAEAEANGKPVRKHCPIEVAGDITRAMHTAGVPIVAGTDENAEDDDPFPSINRELALLVRYAGLSPQEAIVAATRNAAVALGKQQDMGTLEVGKLANMMFVKNDPLQDIENLRSVQLTVKRGLRFARADYHFAPMPAHDDL